MHHLDGNNPAASGCGRLLPWDVCEHAYCIHRRNRPPGYLDAFVELIHRSTVNDRLIRQAGGPGLTPPALRVYGLHRDVGKMTTRALSRALVSSRSNACVNGFRCV